MSTNPKAANNRPLIALVACLVGMADATASDISVAGISLGASPQDARAVLKEFQPGFTLEDITDSKIVLCTKATSARQGNPGPHKGINAGACFYPFNKVWFVAKAERFENGYRPTAKATLDALIEKYGPASSIENTSNGAKLDWQFDRTGKQYKGRSSLGPCQVEPSHPMGLPFPHHDDSLIFFSPVIFAQPCGVVVRASFDESDGMVNVLTVSAYDSAIQFDAKEAIKARNAQDRKQQLEEEAGKAIKPSL